MTAQAVAPGEIRPAVVIRLCTPFGELPVHRHYPLQEDVLETDQGVLACAARRRPVRDALPVHRDDAQRELAGALDPLSARYFRRFPAPIPPGRPGKARSAHQGSAPDARDSRRAGRACWRQTERGAGSDDRARLPAHAAHRRDGPEVRRDRHLAWSNSLSGHVFLPCAHALLLDIRDRQPMLCHESLRSSRADRVRSAEPDVQLLR